MRISDWSSYVCSSDLSMRWIPKGMTVEYLRKAVGTMRAVATPARPVVEADAGYELPVEVEVTDPAGEEVFRARIAMWVWPRRTGRAACRERVCEDGWS